MPETAASQALDVGLIETEYQRQSDDFLLPLPGSLAAMLANPRPARSGALVAPSALFTENALRPFVAHMGDRQFLLTLRIVLVTFTVAWEQSGHSYESRLQFLRRLPLIPVGDS